MSTKTSDTRQRLNTLRRDRKENHGAVDIERLKSASVSAEYAHGEMTWLLEEADLLAQLAKTDKFTDADAERFDELTADNGLIAQLTEVCQAKDRREARFKAAIAENHAYHAGNGNEWTGGPLRYEPGEAPAADKSRDLQLRDSNGKWHRAMKAGDRVAEVRRDDTVSFGEMAAFWLTRDESVLNGKSPMAATTAHGGGPDGGYFLPSQIWGEVVDLARASMVTGRAGIRTLNMGAGELTIVKVASDPTGNYTRELQAATASSPTFSTIVLKPKKYTILIPISREAREDAGNLSTEVQRLAIQSVRQAMDLAVLSGSGAEGAPRGILNTAGVNTATSVGTPTSYSEIVGAVRKLYDANYDGDVADLAWIHSAREWETYANLVTTGSGADGQPLQIPPAIASLPSFTTTAMSTTEGAGAESSMIVGHFPSAVLALRGGDGVSIDILNAGSASTAAGDTLSAVEQDFEWLRVTMRFDVAVLRPDWFTVLSGVTAS